MNRPRRNRYRISGLLLLVVGLLAAVGALAGFALAKDGNRDRLPDRWEKHHHLSLKVNQAGRDQDRDHLRNRAEFLAGDNPRDRDSDDDGVVDGEENAGTIESFDVETGKLVVSLFGGETASGLVTERTKLECEDEHSPDVSRLRSDESEPGDDRGGRGEEEPGDDNGGEGKEEGDDNGTGANCTTSDLIPGAAVQEADLEIEHGKATFDEVELAG